jgi:hypothetical protein
VSEVLILPAKTIRCLLAVQVVVPEAISDQENGEQFMPVVGGGIPQTELNRFNVVRTYAERQPCVDGVRSAEVPLAKVVASTVNHRVIVYSMQLLHSVANPGRVRIWVAVLTGRVKLKERP